MTCLRTGLCLTALALLTALATADPQVDAINAQIKAMRTERADTLKKVHAWYTNFIKRDRYTEQTLEAERIILRGQEEVLLAVNSDPAQRKAIRAHFESLIGTLRIGEGLKEAEIAKLRLLRLTHENQIKAVYDAKIEYLQGQAKVARALAAKKKK